MRVVALRGGIGRLDPDGTIAELDQPCPSLRSLLRLGHSLDALSSSTVRRRWPIDEAPLAPAVDEGATIFGVGLNYLSKQLATGRTPPDEPVLFIKAASSLGMPGEPVTLPAASDCIDYEGEIAAIIGTAVFEAEADTAIRAVAGVATANDVTARDVMRRTGNPSLAKSFPGFGQVGSFIGSLESMGGPDAIDLRVTVNGVVRQTDCSAGMLLSIGSLIALISRYVALRPGDIVLTGTPAGTGDEEQRYLVAGDLVEVAVGDLPVLRNEFTSGVEHETDRRGRSDERSS